MTNELDIELRDGYHEDLADSIAVMFNSWDELWPGGFTRGVPYTADEVHRMLGTMRATAILLAVNRRTGKPVGFVSLMPHWRDADAAYIAMLGVSPEALNKRVGKRLLLRAIAIATEKGYRRVDLHTWAGNLRAVPLYKKVGLMWNPEMEGVLMQDFIPEIVAHPLCTPFFQRHDGPTAWYDLQQRELEQAPDEMHDRGMAVYIYRFAAAADSLRVVVDRYARAITGVERVISDQRLRIQGRVEQHLTLCGFPATYLLEVENRTSDKLAIRLSLEGFPSLHWDGQTNRELVVAAGHAVTVTVPFHLDESAPLFRKDLKCPAIVAHLTIGGQDMTLRTGLKIESPAEIDTRFGRSSIMPGGTAQVPVTVVNKTRIALRGKLRFEPPEAPLKVSPMETDIALSPEGLAGGMVEVAAPDSLAPGTYDLWASVHVQTEKDTKQMIKTRKYRIPIFCIPEGTVALGEDDRKRELIAESSDFTVRLAREGGSVTIQPHVSLMPTSLLTTEVGPPFGQSPFRFAERNLRVENSPTTIVVHLTAVHPERPLDVDTRVVFTHNSPVVRQETWVTNQSKAKHTLQLRLAGLTDSISLTLGQTVIPLASGIVREGTASPLANWPAILTTPQTFSEGWVALEGESLAIGQVWNNDDVEELRLGFGRITRVTYHSVTIEPGESRCISTIWHITRAADWRAVQRVWLEQLRRHVVTERELLTPRDAEPLLQIAPPPIILAGRGAINVNFRLRYSAATPLTGSLFVEPPNGWFAALNRKGGQRGGTALALSKVTSRNLPSLQLSLSPGSAVPDGFAVFKGSVTLHTPRRVRQEFPIIQLGSSRSSVEVSKEREKDCVVFRVKNGVLEFAVSPDFGGCLYSLKNRHSTELLNSAFPTPQPKIFLQNYWGGVQPIVAGVDEDPFLSKNNLEKMHGAVCAAAPIWKGVEVKWKGTLQQSYRGLAFTLRYLTAPGSPVVLVEWTIRNPTTAPLRLTAALGTDTAINRTLDESVLQARWGDTIADVHPSPAITAFMPSSNFAWLRRATPDAKASEGVAMLIPGRQPKIVVLQMGGKFGLPPHESAEELCWFLLLERDIWLQPGEKHVLRAYLLVDPPNTALLEQLQQTLEYIH
jgi:ribosomal protein S18 acetylase RimI-like enzyme